MLEMSHTGNYKLHFFYLTDGCVYQIQEKHLGTNNLLYMAVVDLKKAIDRVLRDLIWLAIRN